MKALKLFASLLAVVAMSIAVANDKPPADYVFTNTTVYTMNEAQPEAEAIAVSGNKIVMVGSAKEAEAYIGHQTTVLNLEDKMVMPGFVDSHNHLIAADWIGKGVLLYSATNKEETLKLISDYAKANPDLPVINGAGWSPEILGGLPTAADLDAIVSDRPVLLIDYTSHEGWLNSAALSDQSITKETPDSLPGTTYWVRDDDGNPTGVGIEFQWLDVYMGLGLWKPETMIRESILKLMGTAATYGTTALLSPGMLTPNLTSLDGQLNDYVTAMEVIEQLIDEGEMPLRSVSHPTFKTPDSTPERLVSFALDMKSKYNNDMHAVTGVKIHPESGLLGYGAPLLEPYAGKDTKGDFGVSPERTMALVMAANKAGLDVSIHTEGDASTHAAIDAFEASLKAGYGQKVRNQLHHYMLVSPADHQRVIDHKMLVNATPYFTNTFGDQHIAYTNVLGEERLNERMGLYSDLAHVEGMKVTLGSDYPGTPITMQSPLFNIQAAMTLKEPLNPKSVPFPPTRKPMTLEQGLRAYTIDAAYFLHMEDKIGSLEVGKLADVVVLDRDVRKVDVESLKDVKVLGTMLDGKFTHREGI